MALIPRVKSTTAIMYVGLSKRYSKTETHINIPPEFEEDNFLSFLRRCPLDLIQVINSFEYFLMSKRFDILSPIDLSILYEDSVELFYDYFRSSSQVKVFFCDSKIKNIESILRVLIESPNVVYFCFYNKSEKFKLPSCINSDNVIRSPFELISKINLNKEIIIQNYPELKNKTFIPKIRSMVKNPSFTFVPSQVNSAILNRIISNYWVNKEEAPVTEEEIMKSMVSDSNQAKKNGHSFERQELLLKQIKSIDDFTKMSYIEYGIKPVNTIEPLLNPLILAYPYHNHGFAVHIETKLQGAFDQDQLVNHASELKKEGGKRILIGLAQKSMTAPDLKEVRQKIKDISEGQVSFTSITYTNLIDSIREGLRETDYEFQDILLDYEMYCQEQNLIDYTPYVMMAVAVGESHDQNKRFNLYYDPRGRNHRGFTYLGLYLNKAIDHVGRLVNTVNADLVDDVLVVIDSTVPVDEATRGRIKDCMKECFEKDIHDIRLDHKFYLVDDFYPIEDFKKSTGFVVSKKYLYFEEGEYGGFRVGIGARELAGLLEGKEWA